jgi:hypothetical protein
MSSDTNGPVLEAFKAVRQFGGVDIRGGTLRKKRSSRLADTIVTPLSHGIILILVH